MLQLNDFETGFTISCEDKLLISHSRDNPCCEIGQGEAQVSAHGAFYDIQDRPLWTASLSDWRIEDDKVVLSSPDRPGETVTLAIEGNALEIVCTSADANRFTLHTVAEADEKVFGGGEQFSYLDLSGRRFPLWVGEPGVGRDPESELGKKLADRNGAGGDYWTTYYPQPTYLSSRNYALHVDSRAFAAFDFTDPTSHRLEFFEIPDRVEVFTADDLAGLVGALSNRFGRQPQLPDWAISGAIVGLKEGETSFDRLDQIVASGAAVSGLWCEDWAGIRQTDFGRRLFWDWQASEERFPNLAERIAGLRDRGIRFLAYINPYLAIDGHFFGEAARLGHLVMHPDRDEPYVIDFGGFECGHIDLTSGAACDWYGERLIGQEMLDIGIDGWMADFAEYLPVDARLADGSDAMKTHNAWPVLWAKLNAEILEKRGRTGDALFFMRSGHSEIGRYCPLLWAGDQSVDFSRHDGIGTTITAALSAGLVGNAYHHSDLGGYTSILGNVRSADLMKRWIELSAFTPVMRSHEGNRPDENLQIDTDLALLGLFGRMSRVHAALAPYTRHLCREAEATGLPVQRPLFLHFQGDHRCFAVEDQYLYGADLLVAPVVEEDANGRSLYLPAGPDWIHLWTGEAYSGGRELEIAAPYGQPPVFFRKESAHEPVFYAAVAAGDAEDSLETT